MNQPAEIPAQTRMENFHRKHRVAMKTMLFSDIVGSTKLKHDLGDERAVEAIERHHEMVRALMTQYPGAEEINSAGDSFFVVFGRPSEAAHFALKLQSQLRGFSREVGVRITNRIGIHVGEIFIREREGQRAELFGIQVDTSARIMALGSGDQILLSRVAYDDAYPDLHQPGIDGVGELTWMSHGFYELKGVEEPIEVCEVGESGLAFLSAPEMYAGGAKTVTFTTTKGKKYTNVEVNVFDTGLNVSTPDGGALVPFNQLPEDLSLFPEKTRDDISKALKVQVFKMAAPRVVVTPGTLMTRFESTLIANYPREEIERRLGAHLDTEAFVPSFTDELPAAPSPGGADVLQTIHYINRKIKNGDRVIYYDSKLKAFVCGSPAFCPNGRVRILYHDCRSFNPGDLNPYQIEKITEDDGSISVGVYTTNREDSITCHQFNGTTWKTHTLVVPVEDDHEARAMCKAIIRFIRVYGGK